MLTDLHSCSTVGQHSITNKVVKLERKILGITKKQSVLSLAENKDLEKSTLSKNNTFLCAAARADTIIEEYILKKGLKMVYIPIHIDEQSIGAIEDPFILT